MCPDRWRWLAAVVAAAASMLTGCGVGAGNGRSGPPAGCSPPPCAVTPDGLTIRVVDVILLAGGDLQPLSGPESRASFDRSCASPPPQVEAEAWRRQAGCSDWGLAVLTSFSWNGPGTKLVRGSDFRIVDEGPGRAFLPLLLCGVASELVERRGCFRDSAPLVGGARYEPGGLYFNLTEEPDRGARLTLRYLGAGGGAEIPLPRD